MYAEQHLLSSLNDRFSYLVSREAQDRKNGHRLVACEIRVTRDERRRSEQRIGLGSQRRPIAADLFMRPAR
jgi:hypothetical protein